MTSMADTRLSASAVCGRYGICSRTLRRWMRQNELGFPRPMILNGRYYFSAREIIVWERTRVALNEGT